MDTYTVKKMHMYRHIGRVFRFLPLNETWAIVRKVCVCCMCFSGLFISVQLVQILFSLGCLLALRVMRSCALNLVKNKHSSLCVLGIINTVPPTPCTLHRDIVSSRLVADVVRIVTLSFEHSTWKQKGLTTSWQQKADGFTWVLGNALRDCV